MSDEIQPYREPVEQAIEPEFKAKRFGLLLKVSPRHVCLPPGFFQRLLLRILFHPIVWRSLWRCRGCGQVWRWEMSSRYNPDEGRPEDAVLREWVKVDVSVWTEAGGKL